MKRSKMLALLAGIIIAAGCTVAAMAQARVELRVGIRDRYPDRRAYFSGLAADYRVPYGEICMMSDAGIAIDDIPAILYIHANSRYSLRQIYSLRLRGATWENLSSWCGVPLDYGRDRYIERGGPPYGKAWGYYRHGAGRNRYEGRYDRDNDDRYEGHGHPGHGRGHRHDD